jgi:hypothetical protein
MTQRVGRIMALALALVWLTAGNVRADLDYGKSDWPLEVTKRPLTLAAGMLEVRGDTLIVNLSKGAVADPVALAPDIYYGVNKLLSVGVTHRTGVCVAGDFCGKVYNDVGIDAIYSLMRGGNLEAAAHGGFVMQSLDPFAMGLGAGLRARMRAGNIAVIVDPTLYVGFTKRDAAGDTIELPVHVQFQVQPQTAVLLRSGLNGPLKGFGDGKQIPVGVGGLFTLNQRMDVGAEFFLPDVAGSNAFDARVFIARLALRL